MNDNDKEQTIADRLAAARRAYANLSHPAAQDEAKGKFIYWAQSVKDAIANHHANSLLDELQPPKVEKHLETQDARIKPATDKLVIEALETLLSMAEADFKRAVWPYQLVAVSDLVSRIDERFTQLREFLQTPEWFNEHNKKLQDIGSRIQERRQILERRRKAIGLKSQISSETEDERERVRVRQAIVTPPEESEFSPDAQGATPSVQMPNPESNTDNGSLNKESIQDEDHRPDDSTAESVDIESSGELDANSSPTAASAPSAIAPPLDDASAIPEQTNDAQVDGALYDALREEMELFNIAPDAEPVHRQRYAVAQIVYEREQARRQAALDKAKKVLEVLEQRSQAVKAYQEIDAAWNETQTKLRELLSADTSDLVPQLSKARSQWIQIYLECASYSIRELNLFEAKRHWQTAKNWSTLTIPSSALSQDKTDNRSVSSPISPQDEASDLIQRFKKDIIDRLSGTLDQPTYKEMLEEWKKTKDVRKLPSEAELGKPLYHLLATGDKPVQEKEPPPPTPVEQWQNELDPQWRRISFSPLHKAQSWWQRSASKAAVSEAGAETSAAPTSTTDLKKLIQETDTQMKGLETYRELKDAVQKTLERVDEKLPAEIRAWAIGTMAGRSELHYNVELKGAEAAIMYAVWRSKVVSGPVTPSKSQHAKPSARGAQP